jgi:Icc-related predicted phosphoesterase
MKIKIVSDLHLEFSDINIRNDEGCDVLILSGDICIADVIDNRFDDFNPYSPGAIAELSTKSLQAKRFLDFFKRVSFQFPNVVYVAGNHEFYHGKWEKTLAILRNMCAKFDNVYFLESDQVYIDDVTFIGGTLWTDYNKYDPLTLHAVRDMMSDFRVIRNDALGYTSLKPATTAERHRKMLHYIKLLTEEKHDQKFVVVSHHAPSFQSVHDHYKKEFLMNGAYASDLSEFILDRPQIKLWTHGHMHDPSDYMMGDTRVICHPRGYSQLEGMGENGDYSGKVVEI